jgi:hypothetical protein
MCSRYGGVGACFNSALSLRFGEEEDVSIIVIPPIIGVLLDLGIYYAVDLPLNNRVRRWKRLA